MVLRDPEFFMFATVTDVAERAGVGETTVIRFCRKVGFRGFQEFKLAVAQHLADPSDMAGGSIESSDSIQTALEKIVSYSVQTLHDTARLLDSASVRKVAQAVLRPHAS
ncbi:MAG: MurR/RpiR family transcriptional regulator [Bacilli bacterium]